MKDLKGIRAGPRSLVHLFAGMEAAAETIRKAREEERDAREANRKATKGEEDPEADRPPGWTSDSVKPSSPASLAALCASPATDENGSLFSRGLSGNADDDEAMDLAVAAAQEVYGSNAGAQGAPTEGPSASTSMGPSEANQDKRDSDLAAIDASLKTRVVRVSGTTDGGDCPAGNEGGLRVFHSFDFSNGPGGAGDPMPSPDESPASIDSSRSTNGSGSTHDESGLKDESGLPTGEPSDAALQAACEKLLIAASEQAMDAEEGGIADTRTDVPPIAVGPPSLGASTAPPIPPPVDLRPRKIYTRNEAGEMEEAVIDPLAATVRDLDPKLVASLVEEARADPKAFAAAAEQQILQTWREAERLEALEGGPPNTNPTSTTPSTTAPMEGLRNLQDERLLQGPARPTQEGGAWATPVIPGATKEEVQGWLKDLELQRIARFFLTPDEATDFFGRLQTAAERVWGPEEMGTTANEGAGGSQDPSTVEPKQPLGEGEPQLWDPKTPGQSPDHVATRTRSRNTDHADPDDEILLPPVAPQASEVATAPQGSADPLIPIGIPPSGSFTATVSPVSYKEWLLRPRGEKTPHEEDSALEREQQTRTAFSRVGCVDAKRPLASVYDHMEPYIQYFQHQHQPHQQEPLQDPHNKGPSLEHFQSMIGGPSRSRGFEEVTDVPASLKHTQESQLKSQAELNEEALLDLLPSPEPPLHRSPVEEWTDSGGIEVNVDEE